MMGQVRTNVETLILIAQTLSYYFDHTISYKMHYNPRCHKLLLKKAFLIMLLSEYSIYSLYYAHYFNNPIEWKK